MIFQTESDLAAFAESLGKSLELDPDHALVLELVGDVGVGKTTFTRALAKGLGVREPVTSPSFTISKRYTFPGGELVHYDFYRLSDPGLMSSDLAEALTEKNTVVVLEWSDSVKNLLPASRLKLTFRVRSDGSRELLKECL
ncbi:tRNA (adenosine(37)-N6)-threonylcarbamoyltransferase complex ATPase subunit type 1 TsaE [Candidatus Saccharibacteria bacterium]|nr:tRNA (adenosine(37)-N6)-threonylcarbamoyltransferase complex ATPase subunit type 1 TsaE [Candidatus Saccharibacteria bacterium]